MVNGKLSKTRTGLALAMACAGAWMLGGCGSSPNAVEQANQDAAGYAMSAGLPRATDDLYNAVLAGTVQKATDVKPGQFVENGADKDLAAGIGKLNEAIALPDIALNSKSALQSQLGSLQLQLAQYRQGQLQASVLALNEQATQLLGLMRSADALKQQADALESGKGSPTTKDVDATKAAVTEKEKALADAEAQVKSLQDQIAAKEAQARKIYTDTDAAFTAADATKGQAGIDAGNKAMEDRKQAELLMEQAGNIAAGNVAPAGSPVLNLGTAQAAVALAKIDLEKAQKLAAIAQTSYNQAKADAAALTQRIAALRAAADKIMGDESSKDTVKSRYAAFMEAAGKIQGQVNGAADAADKAAAAYGQSLSSYNAFIADLNTRTANAELDAKDSLKMLLKDDRPATIILWSQCAAQQQAGRALLAGDQAGQLLSAVAAVARDLKLSAATATINPDNRSEAGKRFASAAATAKTANSRNAPPNGDLDRIKWIGLALEATANEGAASTGNGAARALAVAAAKEAVGRNPSLEPQLGWIK